MHTTAQLICALFFAILPISGQVINNKWKGIQPLHSTRKDIERLFGAPMEKDINLYETDKERVVVWYSDGTCRKNKSSLWNVPKETVLGLLVSPKDTLTVPTFVGESIRHFKKEAHLQMQGRFIYNNQDNSVRFQTTTLPDGSEDIIFIVFSPSVNDSYLICKFLKSPNSKK